MSHSNNYYTMLSVALHCSAFMIGYLLVMIGQRKSDQKFYQSQIQKTFRDISEDMITNMIEVHPDKGTQKAILEVIAKLQYIRRDSAILPNESLVAIDDEIYRLKDLYLSGAQEIKLKKVS